LETHATNYRFCLIAARFLTARSSQVCPKKIDGL
jgi:hypothetical protein